MGLKECVTISEVFILVSLLSIGTYADHTASETVKNQCSIVCPRAHSCQLTSLSGRFYLQCTRLGRTYKLHPYEETKPTRRHVERKLGRIRNAYKQVIALNQNLVEIKQQLTRTNAFRGITEPRTGQTERSRLINVQNKLQSQLRPATGLLPRQTVERQNKLRQRLTFNQRGADNSNIPTDNVRLSEFHAARPVVDNIPIAHEKIDPIFGGHKMGPIVPTDVQIVKPRQDTLAHEYLPDNMPPSKTRGADLSRLLNFSPFGKDIDANTARTIERTRQVGLTTRQRVDERQANSIDPVDSQFAPTNNDSSVQFRPPINELPGASPGCDYCEDMSNCTTTARPTCFYLNSCGGQVCQSHADIKRIVI